MPGILTPICQQLQIEHPVFQAGMGWVARADLAAAVSAAGGLGCIGAGSTMDADELRAEIRSVREQTDRPFAVDILFATVAPKVNEAVRYTDKVAAMENVVFEERVPVLISGLGSPKDAVPTAKELGINVMSVVGAVRHAHVDFGRHIISRQNRAERVRLHKVPMTFSKTPGGHYRHAEQLGQSAETALAEIGCSPEDVADLRKTSQTGPTDGSKLGGTIRYYTNLMTLLSL